MLVSRDLDLSMSLYLQFSVRFGCHDDDRDSNTLTYTAQQQLQQQQLLQQQQKQSSVLIQFSNNAGITWRFLHELHSTDHTAQQSK